MKILKNLKHIFAISLLTLLCISLVMRLFGGNFLLSITHFFVYRESVVSQWISPDRYAAWTHTENPNLYHRFAEDHPLLSLWLKYDFRPSSDIVLIKIDDASLNYIQAKSGGERMLTIPKSYYIDLIESLESAGVKGIAFDIIFQNRDPDEERFAQTLQKYDNIVIAAQYTPAKDILKDTTCSVDENGVYTTCPSVPRSVYASVPWGFANLDTVGNDRRSFFYSLSGQPYASWISTATGYTLPLALYMRTEEKIPTEPHFELELTPFFWSPNKTYTEHPLGKILMPWIGKTTIQSLKGKYVLIGESGTIIHDSHISPVTGTLMDGVESHAHVLDGLLQGRPTLEEMPPETLYAIIILLTLISTIVYLFLPSILSPFLAMVSLIVVIGVSRSLYFYDGYVVNIFPIFLSVGLFSFPITFIYRFFIIDREKRKITSAFSHYVDPTVVQQIADTSENIVLGGEERELTLLFSDIAGFTTLSEKLKPLDLFTLMSAYLSKMTDILTSHGGTLDKYIGDAVMGFYGAPISQVDHAKRACTTALAMREKLPEFNAGLVQQGLDPIDFRVGIASGKVMVGNIGSSDRFNYTVLGDTVNLASRLEGTSKEYGTHILVAEPTMLATKEFFHFRQVDRIAVKGKTEGIAIYELIAPITDTLDLSIYRRYEAGLGQYFAEKYLEAWQIFESIMTLDAPANVMAHRCHEILLGKVQIEHGIYVMTHK